MSVSGLLDSDPTTRVKTHNARTTFAGKSATPSSSSGLKADLSSEIIHHSAQLKTPIMDASRAHGQLLRSGWSCKYLPNTDRCVQVIAPLEASLERGLDIQHAQSVCKTKRAPFGTCLLVVHISTMSSRYCSQ
jgi:hypothetical protein